MDALSSSMRKQFEDRLWDHLKTAYSNQIARMAEQEVRNSIRVGTERAGSYGITTERDVARFIDLMYFLSADFDTNAETSWVRLILDDPKIEPAAKMDLIYDKA